MAADFMMGSPTALADASLESEVSYHTFNVLYNLHIKTLKEMILI